MNPKLIDFFIAFAPVAIGVIGLLPLLKKMIIRSNESLRAEYIFAKEFLTDIENIPKMHPFTKEKGYQALANNQKIHSEEAEFLLTLTNPVNTLRNFILGREYLELANDSGNKYICFSSKYKLTSSRKWHKLKYTFFYFLFVSLASTPIFISIWIPMNSIQFGIFILVTLSIFCSFAWLSLRKVAYMQNAEALISTQENESILTVKQTVVNDRPVI
jgi:hypothetical protein